MTVRAHIRDTIGLVSSKVDDLLAALRLNEPDDLVAIASTTVAIALDIRDILIAEQAWIRGLSPGGLETAGVEVLAQYRLLVVRGQLLGDAYAASLNPAATLPWITALATLRALTGALEALPE